MRRWLLITVLCLAAVVLAASAGAANVTVDGTVTAGTTLSVAGNGTPSFNLTLNGVDQTVTYVLPVSVIDARGLHRGRLEPDGHVDAVQGRLEPHLPDDGVDDHRRYDGLRDELDMHAADEQRQQHQSPAARRGDAPDRREVRQRSHCNGARHNERERDGLGRRSGERLRRHVLEHRNGLDRRRALTLGKCASW